MLLALSKNTNVYIGDTIINETPVSPFIYGTVYGGGEVANVGNYQWKTDTYSETTETIGDISLLDNGLAKVTVNGGTIGAIRTKMRYELASYANDGKYDLKYNDDRGHVFGGGEGRVEDPENYAVINPSSTTAGIHNNKRLIDLMAMVGETDVTVKGSAWVKGSVYGGGYSGHVMNDTKVTVKGGQIGAGNNVDDDKDEQYTDDSKFINPLDYAEAGDIPSDKELYQCIRWDYDPTTNHPFDAKAIKETAGYKPTDGKTWFGNVFGGGSGYYPYYKLTDRGVYEAYWNREAGKVYGNATVVIEGGHILSNVYGGCETTDVGHFTYDAVNGGTWQSNGAVTVTMSGGTVGVPRTKAHIEELPLNLHLFGAGMGDYGCCQWWHCVWLCLWRRRGRPRV